VTWRPLPSVRELVPDIPRAIEEILTASLDRDPNKRPTAAAMGRALDKWCESQAVVASPDRLQEHLAAILTESYQPPTASNELTHFSIFKRGLRLAYSQRHSWWSRMFKRA